MTDPDDDGTDAVSPWAALRCFKGRHWLVHLTALAAAVALWWSVYLAAFRMGVVPTGPLATGIEARAARRLAGGIAGAVAGLVVGAATMRRLGGPFLNFLFVALLSVIAPVIGYPLAFGELVTVYAPASDRFAPRTLIAAIPGMVTFFLGAWLYVRLVWDEAAADRWRAAIPPNPIITPTDE